MLSSVIQQFWFRAEEIAVIFTFIWLQELDDICVILISNLPERGFSVEEVSNLAKPFGGLRDVLILSSHKKVFYLVFSSVST